MSSKNPSLPTLVADVVGQLAAASESEELEFKATTGQREEAAKALCGMLNGRGGRVIFGVDPKGNVVGQQVADKTLEQLAETFGRIQPDVNPHIETIALGNDRTVIITSVAAGQLKPYLYRGSAYRRVGPTTIKMTWDEQQKLLLEQVHRSQRWELERSPLSISDIDLDLLNTTITDGIANRRIDSSFPVGRTPQQLLLGLGLLRDGELTHAAAVLFGKAAVLELEYLQCVAKLAVFEGKGVTKLLEVRQFYGNAFELIEQTERFILDRTRIISELRPDEFRRRDTPEIPVLALREAIANAVAHREYHTASGSISAKIFDDRVEITSVGSLHFNLSPDQLYQPHEARPWNPNIANMLYRRGTVETLGTGTLRMMDHACTASLPMPLITADNQSVKVTFSRYDHIPPQLAEFKLTLEQLRVLRAIRASEPASRSKIAEEANLPDRTTRTLLDHLRSKQLADFTGERATARWHLTGPARLTYGLDPLPTK